MPKTKQLKRQKKSITLAKNNLKVGRDRLGRFVLGQFDNSRRNKGRPPLFKTPQALQKKIDAYFKKEAFITIGIAKDKKKSKLIRKYAPTISGLALYCGFADRRSFYEYEDKEEFTHTIKRARARIEEFYERLLQSSTPTGAIFALKNFGWHDEIYHKGDGSTSKTFFQDIKIEGRPTDELVADLRQRLESYYSKKNEPYRYRKLST